MTHSQRLAALLQKKQSLEDQIRKEKARAAARERARFYQLAVEAGLDGFPSEILLPKFKNVKQELEENHG